MSKASDTFREHHRELLGTLTEQVDKLTRGATQADADALVSFLKNDLVPHAQGEEVSLYPAVDPLVRDYGKPTATMIVDHEHIKNYIKEIEQTAAQFKTAPAGERAALGAKLARLGIEIRAVLRVHLDKEEKVYLPLVEKYVSAEEQEHLLEGMHGEHDEPAAPAPVIRTLDVRKIAPQNRHALIFSTFEALKPGQVFVLLNDHDPKPLFYQFQAERSGEFSWDYDESGPQVWKVRIGRQN